MLAFRFHLKESVVGSGVGSEVNLQVVFCPSTQTVVVENQVMLENHAILFLVELGRSRYLTNSICS